MRYLHLNQIPDIISYIHILYDANGDIVAYADMDDDAALHKMERPGGYVDLDVEVCTITEDN